MKKRIFIAINPPEKIKEDLLKMEKELDNLFPEDLKEAILKWSPKENLHLTLVFIGETNEDNISKIEENINIAKEGYSPFYLNFKKISYGPTKQIPPRLIWLKGDDSPELTSLTKEIKNRLHQNRILKRKDDREYTPHITLSRIRKTNWRKMEPEDRPNIKRKTDISFKAESIDIMESILKRTGAEYTILKSIPLS